MRSEIIMPKMGESVTEGTILKWHKKPGDFVKRDEIIFEISTDKVDTEIPSQHEGYIGQILFGEGETVEVGTVVAVMESEQGSVSAAETKTAAPQASVASAPAVEEPKSVTAAHKKEEPAAMVQASGPSIDISMPKMGESVMEGTIIKWHKKVGDAVKKDEIIFEISTDKVDTEVPSPSEGVVSEILVAEQETVSVGTVVARLGGGGSTQTARQPEVQSSMHDMIAVNTQQTVQSQKIDTPIYTQPISAKENIPANGSRFYSPLVMNIAKEEGVSFDELEKIAGSGQGGRVSKNDILAYVKSRTGKGHAQTAPQKTVSAEPPRSIPQSSSFSFEPSAQKGPVEVIPMDNIRQKIMMHMIHSRDTSVHVTGLVEVDMTRVAAFINANKEQYIKSAGVKLTFTAFISHAVTKALQQYPMVNASIDENSIIVKRDINLGIAVALEPNGLIVPNIKRAGEKNIIGMARGISEIAEKARTRKLSPDDISGGTFTITNYGVFGTLFGTPIINQPEVAILGVGAVVKRPVVVESDGGDMIAIRSMMYLTLSHDHRLVDGMLGGKFLKAVKDNLENFNENLTD